MRAYQTIWRYVFREVIGPTLLGLALYVLVFLMNALFELAELAIKKDLPFGAVAQILFFFLPRVLVMSLPMAILLGTLVGIGRLSTDSEVTALRASGVSYWKLLSPVLSLGLLTWALGTFLVIHVEPRANYTRHRIMDRLLYTADFRREIKPRVFFEEVPGLLLYADEVHEGGDFLERVLIHQTEEGGKEVITLARRAQIDYDRNNGVAEFFLETGTTHTTNPLDPEHYQVSTFERQKFIKPPDESFRLRSGLLGREIPKNFWEQTLSELADSIREAGRIQHSETRARIVGRILAIMHERFALPFACLAFAIVGVPLGIMNRRGGKASGFTLSVGIAIVYWVLWSAGEQMVSQGRLSPYVGLWVGNAFLVGLGILLFSLRERFESIRPSLLIPRKLLRWRAARRRSADPQPESAIARPVDGRTVRNGASRRRRPDQAPGGEEPGFNGDPPDETSTGGSRPPSRWPWWGALAAVGAIGAGVGTLSYSPFLLVGLTFLVLILLFSTTLDRYVLGRFAMLLSGCLLSLFTLFAVYEFVNLIDELVERGQPFSLALAYIEYRSPWILAQVLPISCLVATLLAFGLMARFNEVTAIKASGTSIYRLANPIVMVTIVICTLAYVNYDYLMPYANQQANRIRDVIRGRTPRSYNVREQSWIFGSGGRLYNFTNYIPPRIPGLPAAGRGTFQGFAVYDIEPASFTMRSRTYARQASYEDGAWILRDGWTREFLDGKESFETFAEKRFDFPESPPYFIGEWKSPEQMTFSQLRSFVRDLRQRGYDAQELTVDLYGKTAFPLVSLTMVVLGLPFCFRMGKRGSLYGVGVAIALVTIFLLTFSATQALGGIGVMPPFLAAWAPNILFAGSGIYLLLRTRT